MKKWTEEEIVKAYSAIVKKGTKPFSIFCSQNHVDEMEAKELLNYLGYLRFRDSISTLRVLKGIIT